MSDEQLLTWKGVVLLGMCIVAATTLMVLMILDPSGKCV